MAKLSIECLEDRTAPATIFNGSVPLDAFVIIPKTGDVVHLSGALHVKLDETFDSSGGLHFKMQMQPQGVSGVDLTTGAKYQGNGSTQTMEIFTGNGAVSLTSVNNFQIIGQGPDNNYTVHEIFHATINANGDVTAAIDNLTIDQGSGG
jgi:hypothetical protein